MPHAGSNPAPSIKVDGGRYFVNTVGLDEELIRRYVKYQEDQEKRRERERRDYDLFSLARPFQGRKIKESSASGGGSSKLFAVTYCGRLGGSSFPDELECFVEDAIGEIHARLH